MEDERNKELERQEFRKLYGLEFEQMGICFNRVEETERSLFMLNRILDQEEGRKMQEAEAGPLKAKDRENKQEADRRQAALAEQQATAGPGVSQDLSELIEADDKEKREVQSQQDEAEARELQIEEDRKAAIRLEQHDREEIAKPAAGSNASPA
eukprot:15937996-Heterocapsa_arctica.AAC.1